MLTSILSFPQGTPKSVLAVARWRVYFLRKALQALAQSGTLCAPEKHVDYKLRLASAEADLDRLESSRLAMAA